ncbi:hypothetical protein FJR11_06585 [Anabaena sp. UHCC 0187]|uniref:hypothetical protein n=1 Tax=Anabaena sp. UHCC 0187 TaxID=2590018 RepID=UPI00144756CF|nr:hypothetical protein [Anabaena sp. UHCC 0187]MTJ12265.1 hypothetical protein [Anabaena sp. UHCC 0187]
MVSLIKGSVGILPAGALGVSFFYHLTKELTQVDDEVYFLERQNSSSSQGLKKSGKIAIAALAEDIAANETITYFPTAKILKPDLLSYYKLGVLPEIVLICPNPDQILSIISTAVELLILISEQEELSQTELPFPYLVLSANGIYFQHFRQIFIEKIEEATLFGRLADLWPDIMPRIVSRFLRGVTIQTGVREGNEGNTIYRPGLRGRTQITGGDITSRERCYEILAGKGAWFEVAPNISPTRMEFDKALSNLSTNLLGQLMSIDDEGNFQILTISQILANSDQSKIRELAYHVFKVGQMIKVYGKDENFEVILDQLMETCHAHGSHIPSNLQWIDTKIRLLTLEPKMTSTESWLLEPLIRYAKASELEDSVNYFESLKNQLIEKLTLAKYRNCQILR